MAKTETTVEAKTTREKITLPRARNGEDPTMFVGVNGVNYLIPKGKAADVPPEVSFELKRAQAADDFYHEAAEKMLENQKMN